MVDAGECKDVVIIDDSNKLNENKECLVPGYYIDNDKVNINIGYMNCSNRIEIEKIKQTKRWIYIRVKEKVSDLQENCIYRTLLNIKCTKKIKNVTLTTEDGTKLEECK